MDYECHVTTTTKHAEAATLFAKEFHWKTSEIARDPVLGDETYFYLTTHDNNLKRMYERMDECVAWLRRDNIPVLREKIEAILHDTKRKLITIESSPETKPVTVLNPMAAWPFPTGTGSGISE